MKLIYLRTREGKKEKNEENKERKNKWVTDIWDILLNINRKTKSK